MATKRVKKEDVERAKEDRKAHIIKAEMYLQSCLNSSKKVKVHPIHTNKGLFL